MQLKAQERPGAPATPNSGEGEGQPGLFPPCRFQREQVLLTPGVGLLALGLPESAFLWLEAAQPWRVSWAEVRARTRAHVRPWVLWEGSGSPNDV